MSSRALCVPPPFGGVRDVVEGLQALEGALTAHRDRRAVFVTAYVTITQTLETWLNRGLFLQNEVVADYVVVFANAYRRALEAYETGASCGIPTAWRQSFDACRTDDVSVVQHLLLGINAHINHDLPFAVLQGGLDVHCRRCYLDHRRIDDALRVATPLVRRRIGAVYQPRLRFAYRLCGTAIDEAVSATFVRARQNSWTLAQALDAARPQPERQRVTGFIDARAARAAGAILARRHAPAAWLASVSNSR